MDVGEPTVVEDQQTDPQAVPQFEWVDQQAQEPRSGVGSRASETNTDDRETIRVRFTESRGQRKGKVKMWKNWQRRRKNNILTRMLRCLHTRHGE